MENPMWERILVDWVNCLKLSKPIHKVTDLKDGVFFSNLQKVIKKTSEIEFDVLTCLFHILNGHYPYFEINDKSNIHLSDLPYNDIASITSLLMHYTCIHDRRDVLTSPLCHNLQPVTQLGIKSFLEKVQECPKLTSEELDKIVLTCLEDKNDKNTNQSQQWLSVAQSSNSSKQSPLLEILKTPASKLSRLQEKDREITRLITDLELIQDEKENLEEDVRLHIEKNKKLEKQLKQKNIEISRLKSEVITLENRTPPYYQDKDFRETQKILRTKIEALEQIIEQCDKENEELQNERDAGRIQVKSLDSQCKTWLEKFIETDNKLQSLTQHSEEYEMKYKSLQAHCSELEALLEELRQTNHSESFIEESFQSVNINRRSKNFEPLLSCEDLAHSVVDVQLKDMQKENENLRLSLEEVNKSSRKLEGIIEELTVERNDILHVKNKFEEELKITTEKLKQLSILNEKMMNDYHNEMKKYECLVIEKAQISAQYNDCAAQLCGLKNENENLKISVNEMEYSNRQLKEMIEKITIENNNTYEELKLASDRVQQLSIQNKELLIKYQDVVEEYESCGAQLNGMKMDNKNLQVSLRNMENIQLHSEEAIKNLTAEKNNILEDKNNVEEELKVSTERVEQMSVDHGVLQSKYEDELKKFAHLEEEKMKISKEYDNCFVQLKDMQKNNEELRTSLEDMNKRSKQLKEINEELIDERNNILEDKRRLDEELIMTTGKLQLLNTNNGELATKYEESMKKCESVMEEKLRVSEKFDTCVAQLTDMQKVNENLRVALEELDNSSRQLTEIIKELTVEKTIMTEDKTKVDNELRMITDKFDRLLVDNGKLLIEYQDAVMKYESLLQENAQVSDEYSRSVACLKDMQKDNDILKKSLQEIDYKFRQLKESNEKLINEKNCLLEDNHLLEEKLKITSAKLQELSIESDKLISKCQDEVNKYDSLFREKTKLSEDYNRCLANLEDIQGENKNLKAYLNDMDNSSKTLKESNEKLSVELNSILEVKNKLKLELEMANEKLQQLSIDNEKLVIHCRDDAIKYESLVQEKSQISAKYDISVDSLKDMQAENGNLKACLNDMDTSYRLLDGEFKMTSEKLQQLFIDNEKLMTEYQNQVIKYKSMAEENTLLSEQYDNCVVQLEDMKKNNEKLKISLKDMDSRSKQLKEIIEKDTVAKNSISEENNKLHEELKITTDELQQLKIVYDTLLGKYNELSIDNEKLMTEYQNLSQQYDDCVVQLGEKQKNNEKLKSSLNDEDSNSRQLKRIIEEETVVRNNISEENHKLQEEIKITTEKLRQLKVECDTLLDKYNELSTLYDVELNKNQTLTQEKADIYKLLEYEKSSKLAVSEELTKVQKDVAIATSKIASLIQDVEIVTLEKKKSIDELQNLRKILTNISLEKSDLANQLSSVTHENEELSKKIESIEEENRELSTKLDNCRQENATILDSLNKISSEKIEFMRKLKIVELELETVIGEKTQIDENKKTIQQDYDSMKLALERVESEKSYYIEENQKYHEQLNLNSCQMNQLQDRFDNIIADNEKVTDKLNYCIKEKNELSDSLSECLLVKENLTIKLNTIIQEKLELCNLLNDIKLEKSSFSQKLDSTILELEQSNLLISTLTKERENLVQEKMDIEDRLDKTVSVNENLILKNSELLNDFNELSNNMKCLESEKNDLYEKLEQVVREKDDINNYMDIKIRELELNKHELSNRLSEISLENEEIKIKLRSFESKVVTLELENNELHEEKSKISKELSNLSTKFEDLIKDKGLLDKELSKLFSQLENIMIEKSKSSADLLKTKNESLSIVEQLADLSCKYQDIQLENEKLKKQLEVSTVEVEEKTLELKIANEKVKTLEVQNIQIIEQLDCIFSIMESASEKLNSLFEKLQISENESSPEVCDKTGEESEKYDRSVRINRISENLNSLFMKIENLSSTLLKENELVSKDLQMYCEQNKHLTAELDQKNKNIEGIDCEIKNLLENYEKVKKENYDLSQEVVDLKLNIQKLTIENNEILENLMKVTEEKKVISNFLDLNNNELQKIIQEREDILEALEMSNKEVENISQQRIDLESKNSELVQIVHAKSSEFETISEEKSKLLQHVDDLRRNIEDITNELDAVVKENTKLLEQLEKVSQVKADFSEELDKVSQEKADLSDKLQNLKKKQFENSEYTKDLLAKNELLTEENTQLLGQITIVSNDLEEKTKNYHLLELSCKQLKKLSDEKSDILEKVSEENKGIFDIVDRLSQEKLEMSDTLNQLSEEKMNMTKTLNKLTEELETLSAEKLKLSESLEMSHKELQKVKRERNEILESQTTIMKETENNILLAHQSAVEVKQELLKRIETAEKDKEKQRNHFDAELKKVREAYVNVVSTNSKLELENVNLRKKIEERNSQLNEFSQVKEAYEKLLEENSKLMTEVDTVKYKRARDREEFVNLLRKEREDADARESKRIRDVRNEYEGKVEKMKDKMLKLYREEVNKEIQKVKVGQSETDGLQELVKDLKSELFEAEQKIHMLETERDMMRIRESTSQRNVYTSRESLHSLKAKEKPRDSVRSSITSLRSTDIRSRPNSEQMMRKVKSVSTMGPTRRENGSVINDRKSTMLPPPNVTEIEETITFSRRTSINGVPTNITPSMEMEDEDDHFNNKYLADLKAGRCITTGNDGAGRLSELAWRNSLVPPHLKSSYPAETQFVSPTHFKEDDLKSGNVELDDSLCKLLPGEKPRQKKDFGTTTYKKPGPPTPSKNGGRLSLQGNEILPLREHNDRSPKKSITPSRIKALFMGRTNSRENSENQCTTPKTNNKRMSLFRKQR